MPTRICPDLPIPRCYTAAMTGRTAFLAALLCAPMALADDASLPQPVERASADDCAIFVEIGKTQLEWGAKPPAYDFFPVWDREGGGTYMEDCPWSALGVAAPAIGSPSSLKGFFIRRPKYSGAGATAGYQVSIRPDPASKAAGAFIAEYECKLERRARAWHLVKCDMRMIT